MANTYSTGTVAVAAGSKTVTLSGGLAIGLNMKPGDQIAIPGGTINAIGALNDATHFELVRPWDGATGSNLSYIVFHMPMGWGDRVDLNEQTAEIIRLLGQGVLGQEGVDTAIAAAEEAEAYMVSAAQSEAYAEIHAAAAQVASAEAAAAGQLTLPTWAALSSIAGTRANQRAEVVNDTGSHTDPVVGGTVANGGIYAWSTSPQGWRWLSETGIASLQASKADKVVLESRVGPLESVIETAPLGVDLVVSSSGENFIDDTDDVVLPIGTDDTGAFPMALLGSGEVAVKRQRVGQMELGTKGGTRITGLSTNYDFVIHDENDNVSFGVLNGRPVGVGLVTALDMADAKNRLAAAELQSSVLSGLQQPVADFNTILFYGQSLSNGQESWPALSKVQLFGNTMLGGDIRPANGDTGVFTQFTPAGLNPLVAQVISTGRSTLSDAAVAALAVGDNAEGESPIIGMANAASWLIRRRLMGVSKPFIAISAGRGGTTIEQLSKVNGQDGVNRYNRVIDAVTQAHTAATTGVNAGKTHAVVAIGWMHGQHDYRSDGTGSTKATKALYKAALEQLRTDLVTDIKAITGQTEDPVFLLDQAGGSYTRDVDANGDPGLHIGMAQHEFALAHPTSVFLAGPTYQVTDKGGHLDSNGSRWFGEAFLAKVFNQTVIEGRRWRHLSPVGIEQEAENTVLVHFYVPKPPLQFASNPTANGMIDYDAKGFRVTDDVGEIVISGVEIARPTIVRLTLARAPISNAHVWYAPKAGLDGNGNLRDSDTFQTLHTYEFNSGSGQYVGANIPDLVGKPYPSANACIAFHLPIGFSE